MREWCCNCFLPESDRAASLVIGDCSTDQANPDQCRGVEAVQSCEQVQNARPAWDRVDPIAISMQPIQRHDQKARMRMCKRRAISWTGPANQDASSGLVKNPMNWLAWNASNQSKCDQGNRWNNDSRDNSSKGTYKYVMILLDKWEPLFASELWLFSLEKGGTDDNDLEVGLGF